MKKTYVKAASTQNMLDAFEAKIEELEGIDSAQDITSATTVDMLNAFNDKIDELEGVDSATDITAADNELDFYHNFKPLDISEADYKQEYIDTDGIFTGEINGIISLADIKTYWNEQGSMDPSIAENYGPDEGLQWVKDTVDEWMKPFDDIYESTQINAADEDGIAVDDELVPVEGEDASNRDQVFMLMEYVPDNGENGMEGDDFYLVGKFFAKDIDEANKQFEAAKTSDPERFGDDTTSSYYISEYNEYFDDGDEVYSSIDALLESLILPVEDWITEDIDEYGNPVYSSTEASELVKADDNMYNAAYSFDAIESKVDEKEQELWDLKDDNPDISKAIEEFDAKHHGEFEPLRFVLEVGYGLSPDDYIGVPPFTVYITNPEIKPDGANDMLKELADPDSIEVYDDITGASTTDDDEEYIGDNDIEDDFSAESAYPSELDNMNAEDEDIEDPYAEFNTNSENWVEVDSKSTRDYDGFLTEYVLYQNTETGLYVCVFGDSEIYHPWDGDWDWQGDDYDQAVEWFENYAGLDDDEE